MSSIEAARQLFPVWAPWGGLIVICALAVISTSLSAILVFSLASSKPQSDPEHWTERARRGYPIARALSISVVANLAYFALLAFQLEDPFLCTSSRVLVTCTVVCVVVTHLLITWRMVRNARYETSWSEFVRAHLAQSLLVKGPIWVMLVMAVTVPGPPSLQMWVGLAAGVVAMLFFAVGGGVVLCRAFGLLRPAPDSLRDLARGIETRRELSRVRVEVVAGTMVNAFALPLVGSVAFTERAVEKLSHDELRHILAHELDHLAEPRSVTLRRVVGVLVFLVIGAWNPIYHAVGWVGLLVALLISVLLALQTVRMAHSMEEHADQAAGAQHAGGARDYALVLEHVYRENRIPAVLGVSRLKTHPDLYDRMLAAGVEPDYERPEPPPRKVLARVAAFVLPISAYVVCSIQPWWSRYGHIDFDSAPYLIAMGADSADVFFQVANSEHERGKHQRALSLLRVSTETKPWRPGYAAVHAYLAATAGLDDEAWSEILRAESSMAEWVDRDASTDEWLESARELLK